MICDRNKLRGLRQIGFACAALPLLATTVAAHDATDPAQHPINCSTAEGDLRALNSEKSYAEEQQALALTAITPAGALIGLVTGTENKKLKILSTDYQKQIDDRIAAIHAKCGE